MRRILYGITGVTSAVLISAAITKLKRNYDEIAAGKYFDNVYEIHIYDGSEPFLSEGDYVHVRNPFNNALWGHGEFEIPYVYEIKAVRFDESDGVYRYQIKALGHPDDNERWYSEEWLEVAQRSLMTKEFTPAKQVATKPADSTYAEIDYWLDTLRHSTDAVERAEANRRLTELTTKANPKEDAE